MEMNAKINPSWKRMYTIGGIAWMLMAVLLVAIQIAGLSLHYSPDAPAIEQIRMTAELQLRYQLYNSIFTLFDIVLVVGVIGLYVSLLQTRKAEATIGASLLLLGTALDVVLRVIFHATTIVSVGYLHAASDSIRAGYIPFAELMGAVGKTGLSLSGMLSGLGILMMGIAMVGGVFQRTTAYLVIVAGTLLAVGSLAVMISSAFYPLVMLSDLLALIAMVLIGMRLYSLGRALT